MPRAMVDARVRLEARPNFRFPSDVKAKIRAEIPGRWTQTRGLTNNTPILHFWSVATSSSIQQGITGIYLWGDGFNWLVSSFIEGGATPEL